MVRAQLGIRSGPLRQLAADRVARAAGFVAERLEGRRLLSVSLVNHTGSPGPQVISSTVFVDTAWAGAKAGDSVSDSGAWFSAPGQVFTFGSNAFATVQSGVNGSGSGGTVDIAAGTYHENVSITQPVSLIGPNANVSGGSATRGAEAVIDGGTATAFTVLNAVASLLGLKIMGNAGISASAGVSVQDDIVNTTNGPALQISGGAAGGLAISSLVVDDNSLVCSSGQGSNISVSSSGNLAIQSMDVSNNVDGSGASGGGFINVTAAGGAGDLTIGPTPTSNQSLTISNNQTQTVGQNQTITLHSDRDLMVNGSTALTVNKDEPITISASRDETVSNGQNVTISGNRTETVGMGESITISAGRDETVGGNTTISTNNNETITISGGRTTAVGKGGTITINGNRTETAGQNQSITIGSGGGDLTLGTVAASGNSIGGSISLTATAGNVSMGDGSVFIANTIGGTASGDAIDIIASGTVPPTSPPTGGSIMLLPGAAGLMFQGNSITTGGVGINLFADGSLSGGPIQFLGNTIGGTAGGDGVSLMVGGAASAPVVFTSNNLSGSGAWKGINFGAASNTAPTTLAANTIGGTGGADGVLIDPIGASASWSGPITIGGSGTQGNLITGNFIGVSLDGGTSAAGGFTGPITLVGNTIGGTAGGDALYCRKAGENSGNLISNNLLDGPPEPTSIGIDVDQGAAGSSGFMIQSNNINGFGNGVQMVSGTGGAIDVTIGGSSPALGNTIQTLRDAIMASGAGTNVVVSNNSDPIFMNYNGVDGETNAKVKSDHNKYVEVNSYQFGVGRGISASTGATVTSSFDSFFMLPGIPTGPLGKGTISAIYVDGASFSGNNDLIDGGGGSGVVSQAIGLQVGADETPTQSISFVYGKFRIDYKAIDNQSQDGAVVDASFDSWGVNQESGITQLIGGNTGLVDYTPWLDSGTNMLPAGPGGKVLPGFAGDFSTLDVGSGGAEVQTGGRINEAIGLLPPGGTIQLSGGSYTENPAINQNMTLRSLGPNTTAVINGAISISGGVALRLQFASPALLQVSGVNTQGTLDLTNSTLFINYGAGPDPIVAIRGELTAGYSGGGWNGIPTAAAGVITSSAARANPNHATAIGYADWADGQGVNTTTNTIELKYTLIGDANLDGQVNSADLQILLFGLNRPGAWDQGDFNYDAQVNSADLQELLFMLNTSLGNQVAATSAAASASQTPATQPTTVQKGIVSAVVSKSPPLVQPSAKKVQRHNKHL